MLVPPPSNQALESLGSASEIEQNIPYVIVEDSPTLTYQFQVSNDSDEPIEFTEVNPSCACTHAHLEQPRLSPHQATTLNISVLLTGRTGPQRFQCRLATSTKTTRVYTLATVVYPRVRFSDSVIHFGSVEPKAIGVKQFELIGCASSEEQLCTEVVIRPEGRGVEVKQGEPITTRTVEGAFCRRIPVEVRFSAPEQPGPVSASIVAHYRCDGATRSTTIGIDCQVRRLVEVVPGVAFFEGSARKSQEPVSRRVLLKAANSRELTISELVSPHPAITVTYEKSEYSVVVNIAFDPQRVADFSAGDVLVKLSEYPGLLVRIPVAVAPD